MTMPMPVTMMGVTMAATSMAVTSVAVTSVAVTSERRVGREFRSAASSRLGPPNEYRAANVARFGKR